MATSDTRAETGRGAGGASTGREGTARRGGSTRAGRSAGTTSSIRSFMPESTLKVTGTSSAGSAARSDGAGTEASAPPFEGRGRSLDTSATTGFSVSLEEAASAGDEAAETGAAETGAAETGVAGADVAETGGRGPLGAAETGAAGAVVSETAGRGPLCEAGADAAVAGADAPTRGSGREAGATGDGLRELPSPLAPVDSSLIGATERLLFNPGNRESKLERVAFTGTSFILLKSASAAGEGEKLGARGDSTRGPTGRTSTRGGSTLTGSCSSRRSPVLRTTSGFRFSARKSTCFQRGGRTVSTGFSGTAGAAGNPSKNRLWSSS